MHEAHRSHAYQHLALRLRAHRPVSIGVLAINIGFLAPIAWLVSTGSISGWFGLIVAYGPLVSAAILLGAGLRSGPLSRENGGLSVKSDGAK